MIRTSLFQGAVAFCIAMSVAAVYSDAEARRYGSRNVGWTKIASQDVDLKSGRVSIDLSGARGSFRAFRLRVSRGSINFTQVQFVYLDGTVHQIDKTFRLDRRERTKPLDVRNVERFADQVNIEFEPPERSRRKARLEIWGRQTRKGRAAKRPAGESVATAGSGYVTGNETGGDGTPPLPSRLTGGTRVQDGDVLFGAQYFGLDDNRDIIHVGRKLGKFSKIRLRVREHAIFINNILVTYESGEPETVDVYSEILTDGETDWLELKGDRFVHQIELRYRATPGSVAKARIEVFGLHSNDWLGPNGEGRKFNGGWVLLGARPAGFIGFDRDVIPVGKNKGGFREIRVSVRDRAITLNQIKVVYADGREDIIPVRARVNAGSTFGPIALRDTGAEIEKIEARYRSRFIDRTAAGKGNAIVEVWAKH